jgi:hypothetical protein
MDMLAGAHFFAGHKLEKFREIPGAAKKIFLFKTSHADITLHPFFQQQERIA